MRTEKWLQQENRQLAKRLWGPQLDPLRLRVLNALTGQFQLRVASGDLILLEGKWYLTHTGLLSHARRNRCAGIWVELVPKFCDAAVGRWIFRATVYRSRNCRGFVGYGDADPANVSSLMHGAEMRIAETRAVNRALRKAYGIGVCSVEELGSLTSPPERATGTRKLLLPPAKVSGNGDENSTSQPTLRYRLCSLIQQHNLDPGLVKLYAADFCGTQHLREATREQIEDFINHLSARAVEDRAALVEELARYEPARQPAQGAQESVGEEVA